MKFYGIIVYLGVETRNIENGLLSLGFEKENENEYCLIGDKGTLWVRLGKRKASIIVEPVSIEIEPFYLSFSASTFETIQFILMHTKRNWDFIVGRAKGADQFVFQDFVIHG